MSKVPWKWAIPYCVLFSLPMRFWWELIKKIFLQVFSAQTLLIFLSTLRTTNFKILSQPFIVYSARKIPIDTTQRYFNAFSSVSSMDWNTESVEQILKHAGCVYWLLLLKMWNSKGEGETKIDIASFPWHRGRLG